MNSSEQILCDMRKILLNAPSDELEPKLIPHIRNWGEKITSINIAKVLDYAIFNSNTSDYTIDFLEEMLEFSLKSENKKMSDLYKVRINFFK